ncbi:MAG: hypothetical protein IPP44_08010 [Ideonella sp.]|nr:hypothetical protein [Ideonella sp.]
MAQTRGIVGAVTVLAHWPEATPSMPMMSPHIGKAQICWCPLDKLRLDLKVPLRTA